jgi:hypothetical protein
MNHSDDIWASIADYIYANFPEEYNKIAESKEDEIMPLDINQFANHVDYMTQLYKIINVDYCSTSVHEDHLFKTKLSNYIRETDFRRCYGKIASEN